MKCPMCNKGTVKAADVEISERVAGHTFTATIRGERCAACGEVFYPGPAVEAFEIAVARALTSTDEAGGETFKYARKAMGIRAEDLANLLGVARETISRWETGTHPIDSAALAVLALMVKDAAQGSTATLDALRARREAKPLSKRVALTLAS